MYVLEKEKGSMSIVPFLICFPFLVSILMYITRVNKVRNMIAYVCSGIIVIADGVFVAQWIASGCKPKWLYYETELIDHLIIGAVCDSMRAYMATVTDTSFCIRLALIVFAVAVGIKILAVLGFDQA